MLATSSLDIIVEPLAQYLDVDGLLATALEFEDGTCTGRFQGMPMFRREKTERVLSFLAAQGVRARDCSFFSDSIYDLPLLEAVGTPIAVNPDFRLRQDRAAGAAGTIREMAAARPARAPAGCRR